MAQAISLLSQVRTEEEAEYTLFTRAGLGSCTNHHLEKALLIKILL